MFKVVDNKGEMCWQFKNESRARKAMAWLKNARADRKYTVVKTYDYKRWMF